MWSSGCDFLHLKMYNIIDIISGTYQTLKQMGINNKNDDFFYRLQL